MLYDRELYFTIGNRKFEIDNWNDTGWCDVIKVWDAMFKDEFIIARSEEAVSEAMRDHYEGLSADEIIAEFGAEAIVQWAYGRDWKGTHSLGEYIEEGMTSTEFFKTDQEFDDVKLSPSMLYELEWEDTDEFLAYRV